MMMMPLIGVDWRSSGPFRKRSLPSLRHLENSRPVFASVSIKKKKIAIQSRTQTSNSDLSYPYLSLPYLYTTIPTYQIPKNLST